MVYSGLTFQGVRYALFDYAVFGSPRGYADFDSLTVLELTPHGLMRAIPYGKRIDLRLHQQSGSQYLSDDRHHEGIGNKPMPFLVVDMGNGRVALQGSAGLLSADDTGRSH